MAINQAPSFLIGDGIVTTAFGISGDYGRSVTVQADGKILVAGYTVNPSFNTDFAIVRYNPNGSLDTSFDLDGKLTTAVGVNGDNAYSITVQADGKILVGGSAHINDWDFALVRYNSDGSLDTSFSSDGKLTISIGLDDDYGQSVMVQADGKILVVGYSAVGNNYDFAIVRYNSDGSLDTSFDGDGKLTTPVGTIVNQNSATLQADGKILIVGSTSGSNPDFALVRYNSDGSLDTSFDGDGILSTSFGSVADFGNSVAIQSDGKILAAGASWNGSSNWDFALVRYNADGSLDNSFDVDGKLTTAIGASDDQAFSVLVQPDGKILVAGDSRGTSNHDLALVRYNSDGSLDTSFSDDGKLTTALGVGNDYAYSVTLQADGKILVAGESNNGINQDFALIRYNADGSIDQTFDAVNTLDGMPAFVENGADIVLDSDVQVYDIELSSSGNYDGASLTLARDGGATAQDVFSAKTGGTLGTLIQDENLEVDGTVIGTVTTNSGGTLVLSFNSNATQSLVNSAMQQIAYRNSSDTPPTSVQINWNFNDGNTGAQGTGGDLSVAGTTTVTITATNDAPVLTGSQATLTGGTEDTAYTVSKTDLLSGYTDAEGNTLSISNLSANHGNVVNNGDGTYTINPTANYNGAVSLNYNVTDGQGGSTAATQSFDLAAVNDAPIVVGDIADQGGVQGQTFNFQFASNIFSDIDEALSYSASLGNGDALPEWLTFDAATHTFSGTVSADSQAALNIKVTATDSGNLFVSDTFMINFPSLTISGTSGADVMNGWGGNNIFVVNNAGDIVVELANAGIDTVLSSRTYSLIDTDGAGTNGGNVENLILSGKAANATGNDKDNSITGNNGANSIDGGAGADAMDGGKGNDTYIVDDDGDTVTESFAGTTGGTDLVKSSVDFTLGPNIEKLTLTGTDNISGTGNALNNTITGNAGDNILNGAGGTDTLKGGLGNDTYIVDLKTTGTGTKAVASLQDAVTEAANGGTDTLELRGSATLTKAGTIIISANVENLDASQTGTTLLNLTGNALGNEITGNDANNALNGGAGSDILNGGLGNDILNGGLGSDILIGGNASDVFVISAIETLAFDTIQDFSQGQDKIEITASSFKLKTPTGLHFDMFVSGDASATALDNNDFLIYDNTTGSLYFDADAVGSGQKIKIAQLDSSLNLTFTDFKNAKSNVGQDIISGAHTINGGAGDDTIHGGDASGSVIHGGNGNDVIYGTSNAGYYTNNYLYGGAGSDYLVGGNAYDQLDGGPGNDTLDGGAGSDVADYTFVNGGGVNVDLRLTGPQNTLHAGWDQLINIERINGTQGNGTSGSPGPYKDRLIGNDDDNWIEGNGGSDYISGEGGNDQLSFGLGNCTVLGGSGDDNLVLQPVNNDRHIINGGDGIDTLNFGPGGAVKFDLSNAASQFTSRTGISGSGAYITVKNVENIQGSTYNDVLTGNSGSNLINGWVGNDTLKGGAGDDTISGGSSIGWDFNKNDNDVLTGGSGSDLFVFNGELNAARNVDKILDFIVGEDQIQLVGTGYGIPIFSAIGSSLDASEFVSGAGVSAAVDADDYIIFNTTNGALYYDADGNGSGLGIKFAILTGITGTLTADDFQMA